MATLHGRHYLPRSTKGTAFHCRVLLVELESQANWVTSTSLIDYARLRCNRAQPCEHCNTRGDAISCSYATAAAPHTILDTDSGNKTQHTEKQLHNLEHLVAEAIKLHQDNTQSPVGGINPLPRHQ